MKEQLKDFVSIFKAKKPNYKKENFTDKVNTPILSKTSLKIKRKYKSDTITPKQKETTEISNELTENQIKVLDLLCQDYNCERIAIKLDISKDSVSQRIAKAKVKLNVTTMQGLIYKYTMNN